MIGAQIIEDLSIKIKELNEKSPIGDTEKNIRALLQGAFAKLDLVTREEYDVQADLLRVSREKLDALEAKLQQMEDLLQKSNK